MMYTSATYLMFRPRYVSLCRIALLLSFALHTRRQTGRHLVSAEATLQSAGARLNRRLVSMCSPALLLCATYLFALA